MAVINAGPVTSSAENTGANEPETTDVAVARVWSRITVTAPTWCRPRYRLDGEEELGITARFIDIRPEYDGRDLDVYIVGRAGEQVIATYPIRYPPPEAIANPAALDANVGDDVSLNIRDYFRDLNPDSAGNASLTISLVGGALAPGLTVLDGEITGTLESAVTGLVATFEGSNSGGAVTVTWSQTVAAEVVPDPPVLALTGTTGSPVTDFNFTLDEPATLHVLVDANATRTDAQVIAGGGVFAQSVGVTTTATITMATAAIPYGTAYYVHAVAVDGSGQASNVVDDGPHTIGTSGETVVISEGFAGADYVDEIGGSPVFAGTGQALTHQPTRNPSAALATATAGLATTGALRIDSSTNGSSQTIRVPVTVGGVYSLRCYADWINTTGTIAGGRFRARWVTGAFAAIGSDLVLSGDYGSSSGTVALNRTGDTAPATAAFIEFAFVGNSVGNIRWDRADAYLYDLRVVRTA